jgi:Protein of unknown function (DUF721).
MTTPLLKRRSQFQLSEAVDSYLCTAEISTELFQRRLRANWSKVTSDYINGYTSSINLREQTLYVGIKPADKLNSFLHLEKEIITEVNAWAYPASPDRQLIDKVCFHKG